MAETKYGKYVVKKPLTMPKSTTLAFHPNFDPNFGGPPRPGSGVFLNGDAIPGCPIYLSVQRTWQVPPKQPFLVAHKHECDEIIFFVAAGPDADLGTNVTDRKSVV